MGFNFCAAALGAALVGVAAAVDGTSLAGPFAAGVQLQLWRLRGLHLGLLRLSMQLHLRVSRFGIFVHFDFVSSISWWTRGGDCGGPSVSMSSRFSSSPPSFPSIFFPHDSLCCRL